MAQEPNQEQVSEERLLHPEELVIKFEGLDADEQRLPLDDFLTSLTGWRDYLAVATASYLQHKLTLVQQPESARLDIRIRQVRPGSQEVVFWISVAEAALGGFIAIKGDKLITIQNAQSLWKWVNALYSFHVNEKKSFHTKEEIASALEKMAGENGIAIDREKPESQRFVGYIDDCLKQASAPVERSATQILVTSNVLNIYVDINARRALKSGFLLSPEAADFFPARVRVRALNLDTGHARLEVLASRNEQFVSKLDKCYIEDTVLTEPGNPYSQSLDTHIPIDVFVSQGVDRATGSVVKWRIRSDMPKRSGPMFKD